MRVLHLTTHLNMGGITIYILRLIKDLKKNGVDTYVLSSGGSHVQDFKSRGAVTFELPFKTKSELSPKLYWNLPKIIRIVRENKIDLLHAHTRVTQVLAFWISKLTGIPYVTTCHGFYKRRLGRRLLPAWGKYAIGISDGVSDHLANDFKLAKEQIRTVFNAVDLTELDQAFKKHNVSTAKTLYNFSKDDLVIGVVARLVQDKGHEYLLDAVKLLETEFPSLRLLVVGDGNYRTNLEAKTRELGLEKRVLFIGNEPDVTKPLAAIDVFSLPATWREGFGLSIIEAMACHKPVIVTNIWALNSLIQDHVTGLLVPPKDPQALANGIRTIFNDRDLREKMGATAREMVERLFSIDRMAKELSEVYTEAVGNS